MVLHIGTALFVYEYLVLKEEKPWMRWSVIALIVTMAAILIPSLLASEKYNLVLLGSTWVWLLCICVLLLVSSILWRGGNVSARRMVVIWVVYIACALLVALDFLSFGPGNSLNMLWSNFTVLLLNLMLFTSAFLALRKYQLERDLARLESGAKSEFLARMSHEIRTPMNGVIGMAEMLQETELTKIQHSYLDVIRNSGRTLLDVINAILDFSKANTGKLNLELAEIDVARVTEECAGLFLADARKNRQELSCVIDGRLPSKWWCDDIRLRQILFNLLGNVLKFTPEKGVVTVTVSPLENNAGVRISVADTGIGISSEQQTHLFDAFSQADVSTSRRFGGTGLGLAICKQLVELMGGSICIDSALGRGSCFHVELPLGLSGPLVDEQDPRLAGKRILFVDDNVAVLRSFIFSGERYGFYADTAANAEQALEKLSSAQAEGALFDLVLSDIDMPGTDGYMLARQIREKNFTAPVVLHSSTTQLPSEADYQQLGIMFATAKHLSREGLLIVLSKVFGFNQNKSAVAAALVDNSFENKSDKSIHVLVAEDNEVNFRVVSAMLKKFGHSVDHAWDGEEAVQRYEERSLKGSGWKYGLILMDCEMPHVNGFDAARRIRLLEEKHQLEPVRIVALTAHVMEDMLLKCREAGMDDHMSKPIEIKVLRQKLLTDK